MRGRGALLWRCVSWSANNVLSKGTLFFHFASYYVCWIACIYFAAHHAPYTGPIVTLIILAAQIFWQSIHQKPYKGAIYFAISLTLLGSIIDTVFLYAGLIYFNANPFGPYFSAPWMICLWLSFGFNIIILYERWLHHYFIWSIVVLFAIPFAYWVGVEAGAAVLLFSYSFYLYLGLLWALLLPISFYLYNLSK